MSSFKLAYELLLLVLLLLALLEVLILSIDRRLSNMLSRETLIMSSPKVGKQVQMTANAASS